MGPSRLDETVKSILSNSFPKEQGHLIQAASMEILQAVGGSNNSNTSSLEEALRAVQSRSVTQDGSKEKPLGSSEGSQKSTTKAPSIDKFAQILASITKHTSSPAHEPKLMQGSVAPVPLSKHKNEIRLDRPKSKIAGNGLTGPFLKTPLEEGKSPPSPNASLELGNRDTEPHVDFPNSGKALSNILTQLREHNTKATEKPEAHVQLAAQAKIGTEARKDLQHGEHSPEISDEKHSIFRHTTQTKQAKLPKLNDTIALASASKSTRKSTSKSTSKSAGASVSVSVSVREGSRLKRCPTRWTPEQDEMLRAAVRIHGPRNWKVLASMVEGRDHVQCLQRWNKVLQPGLVKGPWTSGEDELLTMLAERYGNHWTSVAAQIPGRTAKQCRERWRLNLDPSINHNPFSFEEDALLLKLHGSLGSRWAEIKMYFTGRTENAVKTRFKSLMRSRARAWPSSDEGLLLKLHAQYGNDWEKIRECGNWKSADIVKKKIKRVLAMPYEYPNARERNKKAHTGGNGAQQVIQNQSSSSSSSSSADSHDPRTLSNMSNLQAAQAQQQPLALNRKRLSSSSGLLSPQNFVTIDASSNGGTLSPMGVAVNVKAPTTLSQVDEENPSKRLKRLISARQLLDSRVSNLVSPVDTAVLLNSNERDVPASRTLSDTSKPWLASGLAGLGQQFQSVNQGVPALGSLAYHHPQQHPQDQYQHQQHQQQKQHQQQNLHQRNILAMAAFQAPGQYSQDTFMGGRTPSDLVSQSKVLQEFSRQANEHRLAVCGSELLRASRSFLGSSNVDLSTLTPGDMDPTLAQIPTSHAFQLLYSNVVTGAATGSGVPPMHDLASLDITDVIQSQGFTAREARR